MLVEDLQHKQGMRGGGGWTDVDTQTWVKGKVKFKQRILCRVRRVAKERNQFQLYKSAYAYADGSFSELLVIFSIALLDR